MQTQVLDYIRGHDVDDAKNLITALGLDSLEGKMRATKDHAIINQLDMSNITSPNLLKQDWDYWDQLRIKKLDKITLDQTLLIELHGGSKSDEIVIIPIEI